MIASHGSWESEGIPPNATPPRNMALLSWEITTPKPPHTCCIYHLIQKRCIGVLPMYHSSHFRVKVTLSDSIHSGSRKTSAAAVFLLDTSRSSLLSYWGVINHHCPLINKALFLGGWHLGGTLRFPWNSLFDYTQTGLHVEKYLTCFFEWAVIKRPCLLHI